MILAEWHTFRDVCYCFRYASCFVAGLLKQ